MIKRYHEAPKSIFKQVQKLTDGDYFLVHLFEEDPEYLALARESVAMGRETVLDNSIFELGTAFDMAHFAEWVKDLNPTWYIVPDALEDVAKTKANMERWNREFRDQVPGKMIGVCQGKSYEEQAHCYWWLDQVAKCDKIAIPFDASWYSQVFPHKYKLVSWCYGRVWFINKLIQDGLINKRKPHHLLGASLVRELEYYHGLHYDFIDSWDSSSPVCHGLILGEYPRPDGNVEKPSQKLYTMINQNVTDEQWQDIEKNIEICRNLCS